NFFRVEGPDIGGSGIDVIESDLFSVSGKILDPANAGNMQQVTGIVESQRVKNIAVLDELQGLPREYLLHQNYPNPFNPSTQVVFELPKQAEVRLEIYNIRGQKVRTLIHGVKKAGVHNVQWNGQNDFGEPVASGIYMIRIQANQFIQHKRMVLLR
ncbi:MAG: FlgD immunoglobulin-like domain containing protein, partial [bacterium]